MRGDRLLARIPLDTVAAFLRLLFRRPTASCVKSDQRNPTTSPLAHRDASSPASMKEPLGGFQYRSTDQTLVLSASCGQKKRC